MKRKITSLMLAIILCASVFVQVDVDAKEAITCEDVELHEILTGDAVIGYSTNNTWGVYYSDGYSIINKISSTKVGAGGVTNAHVKCTVGVNAILERKNDSGSWVRVNSWSQTNENAYSAVVSKSVTVASGYYYRVRSYHSAGSDAGNSFTNALWVGN